MKFDIEKKLFFYNRLEIILGMLTLTGSGIGYFFNKPLALILLILSVMLLIPSVSTFYSLKNDSGNMPYSIIYKKIYSRIFERWLTSNLDDRLDLVDRKYNLLFLLIWLRHKGFNLYFLQYIFKEKYQTIKDVSSEILEKKISSFDMNYLQNRLSEHGGSFSNVIEEKYEEEKERINLAYESYKDMGILGNEMVKWNNIDIITALLITQQYKLSEKDMFFIEHATADKSKKTYSKIYYEIIENENDIEKLEKIKNFFASSEYESFESNTSNKNEHEQYIQSFTRKINYNKLNTDLKEKENNIVPTKRNKI